MPRPGQDGKRPAAELEHGGGHVDVAVVGEPRGFAHGAVGVDLHDLLARDEAQRVEVVDVEVAEDAAGARDVRLGRRAGIVRRRPGDQQAAERAARDRLPGCAVAGVESPLEADLHEDPAALDVVDRGLQGGELQRHRLLAEGRQPGAGGQLDHRHVRRRRASRSRARRPRRRRGRPASRPPRGPARRPGVAPARVRVAHGHRGDARQRRERANVKGPDTPGADDADAEGGRPRFPCSGLHR